MELLQEIVLTAIVAVLFSFLIAKLVSVAMSGGSVVESESKSGTGVDEEIIVQELQFGGRLKVKALESERKVEFVEEIVSGAEDFGAAAAQVEEITESVASGPELEIETLQQPEKSEYEVKLDDVVDKKSSGIGKGTGLEKESASEVADAKEESPKADKAAESATLSREMEAEACQLQEKSESEVKFDDFIEGKVENKEVGEMVPEKSESEVNKQVREMVQEKSESEVKCDDAVQENVENREVEKIGEEFETKNDQEAQSDEFGVVESKLERLGSEEKEMKSESDDDWEDIERSELEKAFAVAVKYVEGKGELEGMESDVKMEMYGLHKVATQGPCRETQPMALKMSARAKWYQTVLCICIYLILHLLLYDFGLFGLLELIA
ncbi:hypothetical protein SLEP1_g30261 [Rubroshorea leprosula]|uniref:ACB domain-containing protein n=1 Tax=Rubroshorea leprosula TaxID=152421 RepID=A0AAV5JZK0_9ROSI|nr:hypothetical protein SLEP1_g30261 [Rubroshorea leprosula]